MKIMRVVGNRKEEIDVSPAGARKLGIPAGPVPRRTVAWLLEGLFPSVPSDGAPVTCPMCGTTRREVILYRRVGCTACYEAFHDTIDYLLHRTSPEGVTHSGRIPQRLARYRTLFVDRERLRERLNRALEEEDFETAAALRDELDAL